MTLEGVTDLEEKKHLIRNLNHVENNGGDTFLLYLLKKTPIQLDNIKFIIEQTDVDVNVPHFPMRNMVCNNIRTDKKSVETSHEFVKKTASMLPLIDCWNPVWPCKENVHTRDAYALVGLYPLHISILKKQNEIAAAIVKAGADVNAKSLPLCPE